MTCNSYFDIPPNRNTPPSTDMGLLDFLQYTVVFISMQQTFMLVTSVNALVVMVPSLFVCLSICQQDTPKTKAGTIPGECNALGTCNKIPDFGEDLDMSLAPHPDMTKVNR